MDSKHKKWHKKIVSCTATVIGMTAGLCAIIQFFITSSDVDLSGEWKVVDTIESSSYKPYKGLE
jgi:hypothetical protein